MISPGFEGSQAAPARPSATRNVHDVAKAALWLISVLPLAGLRVTRAVQIGSNSAWSGTEDVHGNS
jgi:hypothetical protein